MPQMVKHVSLVIHFILGILCLLHVVILIYDEFHPSLPLVEILEKNLDEIEFPLTFKICILGAKDKENNRNMYNQFGYKDNVDFFMGFSKGSLQNKKNVANKK